MQFFRINHASTKKEIGVSPQVNEAEFTGQVTDPEYLGNFYRRRIEEPVIIPKPILRRGAKLTQCLSVSFVGFSGNLLISETTYTILKSMECYGVQFFPTELISEKHGNQPYCIVYPYAFGYPFIDVKSSVFQYTDTSFKYNVIADLTVDSAAALEKAYNDNIADAERLPYGEFTPLYINHLVLREDTNVDFFALRSVPYGGLGYYASERLRGAMEAAGSTGVVFTELNERRL